MFEFNNGMERLEKYQKDTNKIISKTIKDENISKNYVKIDTCN